MRLLFVVLVAVMLSGCSNYHRPEEKAGYRLACEALQADKSVPDSVEVLSIDDAEIYIAKNAGYVVLHYATNSKTNAKYVVHLKRVARTWLLDSK